MNIPTKYAFTSLLNAALAVFTTSLLFGWGDFTDKLGGAKSFAGLVALIVMGAIIVLGILYLQFRDYNDSTPALIRDMILAALVVFLLGGIGYSWMTLPDGAGVKILASLAAIAAVSGVEVWLCRRDESTS
ncbi:MAG: hypothetical protein JWM00_238 [Candidatus Saccharibacteria bacterium]|nr:hypothetical protein [Candidatus Saccharibacteria bacterium]